MSIIIEFGWLSCGPDIMVPKPVVKDQDLLVKNIACSMRPVNTKMVKNGPFKPKGSTLGHDPAEIRRK